jgi:NADPH:quinone reductase-like Zn-dependent oxidoreductase
MMKSFVLNSYGGPENLELTDVDQPVPGDDEVLVRVRATSVQPYDWHLMRGEPYAARLIGDLGLRTPPIRVLGADIAGEVEAVGGNVTEFRPGDEVFAMPKQGGFGEYVCVPEHELAPKPQSLSFEQAASVPLAAGTALIGLRDVGRVKPGQKVLVNGASGGVGTFGVQLAKALGAEVTGVCGTRNVDLVRSLGADEVVDYTVADFTRGGQRYDIVLDCAGSRSFAACRRVMAAEGTFVLVGGSGGRWLQPMGHMVAALALAPLVSQRVAMADVIGYPDTKHNLITLTEFIENGNVKPVIDRTYSFAEIPAAIEYQEQGHASGKVVVTI